MTTIGNVAVLRDGVTMADVERLASVAARRHGGATDFADRYDAAWFGIVEALYGPDHLDERELLFAGIRAVQVNADQRNQAHGRSRRHDYEYGTAAGFARYWTEGRVVPSHEDRVVERTALAQALATLTGEQYEALAAAAVCDTLRTAATSLGITYDTFLARYYSARARIRELWHEGETVHLEQATEAACGSGHDRAQHTATGPSGRRYCRECQRLAKQRRRARGQR